MRSPIAACGRPGERARACENLQQHEALSYRDDYTAGSLWKLSCELL